MQKITVKDVEYDLELTVGSFAEISEVCPGGDFSRIDELLKMPSGKAMLAVAKMIAAMSKGAEEKKKFEDPAYSPRFLTYQEMVNLPLLEFQPLQAKFSGIISNCLKEQKIKTEPSKKKEKMEAAGELSL